MKNLKISILMPSYNSEKFISKSIESIINQSISNYEFIIVDDGSDDGTREIINKYIKSNNKIRLLSKSNSGLTDTLNYGLKNCSGEWVARLDSDDLSLVDRLKKQLLFAESNKKIGLVGSDAIFIDQYDKYLYRYSYPAKHKDLKCNLIGCKKFFPHSSAFFNRELVDSLGGYRIRAGISEDWDLWLRIAQKSQIRNINCPLIKIRLHKNQVSKKHFLKQGYDTRTIIIANWLKTNNNYDPLEVFSDNEFDNFKNHIREKLEKIGFSEYLNFLSLEKKPIYKRLSLILLLLKKIRKPLFMYYFFKLRFFSKNINDYLGKSFHNKFYRKKLFIKKSIQ